MGHSKIVPFDKPDMTSHWLLRIVNTSVLSTVSGIVEILVEDRRFSHPSSI